MQNIETYSLKELADIFKGAPGLVFGSQATCHSNTYFLVYEKVCNQYRIEPPKNNEDLEVFVESISELDEEKKHSFIEDLSLELQKIIPNSEIEKLSQIKWSCCISLTKDVLFESKIRDHYDSLATSKAVTIIDHHSVLPERRDFPIYKLLGNLVNSLDDCKPVFTESSYLLRKSGWFRILGSCSDFLQGGALIFYGLANEKKYVKELLSTLASLRPPSPNTLYFLKDDELVKNPVIRSLCQSFSIVKIIDATVFEFGKFIEEFKPTQLTLDLGELNKNVAELKKDYYSILDVVPNNYIEFNSVKTHSKSLVDSLFRPNRIDWSPYLCKLEIARDCKTELVKSVLQNFISQKDRVSTIVLRGDAGVGKTTVLKGTAVELSSKGVTVLWLKKSPIDNWIKYYSKLVNYLNDIYDSKLNEISKVAIFVDDPWSLRLDASELTQCFERLKVPTVIMYSFRNSEYFSFNGGIPSSSVSSSTTFEVPNTLSESEFLSLKELLVNVGAAATTDEVESLIRQTNTRDTRDILCSLWYLVPDTRNRLASSLKDEYHRLDIAGNYVECFAQEAKDIGKMAQHAYEFVCVCSRFNIGLPLEVLVSALEINYEDFIDLTVNGQALWGLLYDDIDEERQTTIYRTRNEVVTKILLQLVNGGVGNAGEYRVLKILLSKASDAGLIFREFAIEILIRSTKELESSFTYEQGLELFDTALNAMEYKDKTIAHHRAKWISKVGKDHKKAYEELNKALEYDQLPGSRPEHDEHIHTSMAAAVVGLVRKGYQTPASGLELVEEHIQKASNPRIYSSHTGHISANLLFEMSQQEGTDFRNQVTLSSLTQSLNQIEKSLQALGPSAKRSARSLKSRELLLELKQKVLSSIKDDIELEEYARTLFNESGSQLGFELLIRNLFSKATTTNKGKDFNKASTKLDEIFELLESKKEDISLELVSSRADIAVRWKLAKPSGEVDWETLHDDLKVLISSDKYREDIIKLFYYGVSLFHLKDYDSSNAIFQKLERVTAMGIDKVEIRALAIGTEGFPKRYQCSIKRSHGRNYAFVSEVGMEVRLKGKGREIVNHVYIGFCLKGPRALTNKPDEDMVLMS